MSAGSDPVWTVVVNEGRRPADVDAPSPCSVGVALLLQVSGEGGGGGVAVGWGPRHAPRQAGCEYQGVGHMEPWEAVCNTPRLNARRAQRARVATLA
jgi:hypothetical protein